MGDKAVSGVALEDTGPLHHSGDNGTSDNSKEAEEKTCLHLEGDKATEDLVCLLETVCQNHGEGSLVTNLEVAKESECCISLQSVDDGTIDLTTEEVTGKDAEDSCSLNENPNEEKKDRVLNTEHVRVELTKEEVTGRDAKDYSLKNPNEEKKDKALNTEHVKDKVPVRSPVVQQASSRPSSAADVTNASIWPSVSKLKVAEAAGPAARKNQSLQYLKNVLTQKRIAHTVVVFPIRMEDMNHPQILASLTLCRSFQVHFDRVETCQPSKQTQVVGHLQVRFKTSTQAEAAVPSLKTIRDDITVYKMGGRKGNQSQLTMNWTRHLQKIQGLESSHLDQTAMYIPAAPVGLNADVLSDLFPDAEEIAECFNRERSAWVCFKTPQDLTGALQSVKDQNGCGGHVFNAMSFYDFAGSAKINSQKAEGLGHPSVPQNATDQQPKGPQPKGQQAKGPQPKGQNAKGHQPKGPQAKGPQAKGPQPKGSQAKGAQPKGPQAKGPQPKGPKAKGPQPKGPQPKGPQPKGPQPKGTQPKGTQPKGPQPKGPQPKGPQAKGPQAKGPQPKGPKAKGPQPKGPQPKGPQAKGPQPKGPPAKGPQPKDSKRKGQQPKGQHKLGKRRKATWQPMGQRATWQSKPMDRTSWQSKPMDRTSWQQQDQKTTWQPSGQPESQSQAPWNETQRFLLRQAGFEDSGFATRPATTGRWSNRAESPNRRTQQERSDDYTADETPPQHGFQQPAQYGDLAPSQFNQGGSTDGKRRNRKRRGAKSETGDKRQKLNPDSYGFGDDLTPRDLERFDDYQSQGHHGYGQGQTDRHGGQTGESSYYGSHYEDYSSSYNTSAATYQSDTGQYGNYSCNSETPRF